MKKYPKYKDSGVSWIGEIPEGWNSKRLKFSCNLVQEKTTDNALPYIALENIESYSGRLLSINTSVPEGSCNLYRANDVLFSKLRPYLAKCVVAQTDGKCSSELLVLRNFEGDNKYLQYLMLSPKFIEYIDSSTYGAKMPRANWLFIGNSFIPLPSLSEQHAIVSYLDKKTEQIDRFVSEAEKEIEKLNELKQAQIARMVTHGLNPNAPMKDSGVAWIGMIPEHWKVRKISSHFKERRTKVSDKDYPALSVAREGVVPQLETAVKTDNGDNRKLVLKNDFVVNSRSDRKGSCGVSDYDGSVSLISIVLEPRDIYPMYVHHLFRSNNYIEEFYRNGRGIVADLWTTRYSEMKNIFIPIPPNDEQQAIVSAINSMSEKIDMLATKLTAQIDNLRELKQRIISDAVTGKIDVRDRNN
ncbi:hypothetical protein HMPREF9431_00862 [Segatella oulorum F0390]|uniref:Type I restriction modification DNA specificity domain-containing protein n=1 Tax=Segatella oulorum F0390 TaxID=702438 RepID=G1WAL1_9BACT|nr:restriction endonuclease subunit S [Segatella oulorum]EGV33264.1 hypothetical protein HMPREF9431_00862 [Segatella oulorum F0390]